MKRRYLSSEITPADANPGQHQTLGEPPTQACDDDLEGLGVLLGYLDQLTGASAIEVSACTQETAFQAALLEKRFGIWLSNVHLLKIFEVTVAARILSLTGEVQEAEDLLRAFHQRSENAAGLQKEGWND